MKRKPSNSRGAFTAILLFTVTAMILAFVLPILTEPMARTVAIATTSSTTSGVNPYMKVVMTEPRDGSSVSNTITLSAAVLWSPLHFGVVPQFVQTAAAGQLSGMPQARALRASWDQCSIPFGGSNAVVTIYKSTSLGSVWTPFKPTAITPASRTNTTVTVVSGSTYRFYATLTAQPFGESNPSNTVTNRVE